MASFAPFLILGGVALIGASASENVEAFILKTNEAGTSTSKRTPKTVIYAVIALETLMLTLLYFQLLYILSTLSWGVSRPDLASKQAVSMLSIALTAMPGLKAWLGNGANAAVHITDRFHGYNKMGELICVHFLCYQLFDLGISLAIPDLRKPEMIAHHVSFDSSLIVRLASFRFVEEKECSNVLLSQNSNAGGVRIRGMAWHFSSICPLLCRLLSRHLRGFTRAVSFCCVLS